VFLPGLQARTQPASVPTQSDLRAAPARYESGGAEFSSNTEVTPELLEKKIAEVAAAKDPDAAAQAKLTELYRKALSNLEAARTHETEARAYIQALETAPGQTQELRRQLEASTSEPESEPLSAGLSVPELEQRLAKEQAAATVRARLGEIEKELDAWLQRPTRARERITAVTGEFEQLGTGSDLGLPEGASPPLAEVYRWALQARQRELRAEIHRLNQDLLSQAVREVLLKAQRDTSERELALLDARQRHINEQLDRRRQAEAEQTRHETEVASGRRPGSTRSWVGWRHGTRSLPRTCPRSPRFWTGSASSKRRPSRRPNGSATSFAAPANKWAWCG